MANLKYSTNEERLAAYKASKLSWYQRNKDKVKEKRIMKLLAEGKTIHEKGGRPRKYFTEEEKKAARHENYLRYKERLIITQ